MGILELGFSGALARAMLLVGAVATTHGALAQERVMIVMDGSGSMWGQIDGVPKLAIARETLRSVLPGVPETTELGLIAYGHREKGNCSDIELVVPAATGTASQISEAVDNMSFLGKTPLSAAVQIAADEVRYVLYGSDRTLVSVPLTLAPAVATLAATPLVAPGGVVQVKWTGPGNRNDFIEIVPAGAEADARPISEARASQGTSISLYAPGSTGLYEVRYRMRDTGEVLASSDLSVE